MSKRTKNWRFKAGELCVVSDTYGHVNSTGTFSIGPYAVGRRTAMGRDLKPGSNFLVLVDARQAAHRQNRRLYMEVMTPRGPAMVWASYFKKRSDT